jgi:hypothetical protein
MPVNIDGDRAVEVVLQGSRGHVVWDFPNGLGAPVEILRSSQPLEATATGEIDGNGVPDAFGTGGGVVAVTCDFLENPESRTYIPSCLIADSPWRELGPPIAADIDGDGDVDLIVALERGLYVYPNTRIERSAGAPSNLQIRFVSEQPARDAARVVVRLREPGPIDARLYDVTGRALWSLHQTLETQDWFEVVVDPGRFGRSISGVYFLRVVGGGDAQTRRLVFLR